MASNRELSPDADIEGVFEGLDRSESPVSRPVSPFRGISPVNFSMEGCETQDIIQVHRARLECMMRMSNHSKLPVDLRLTYEQRGLPALENRARAVRWITEVANVSRMSPGARESGIELFDKFVSMSLVESPRVLEDTTLMSFSAASAILLSSKLHEGKTLLTVANFPDFHSADLIAFERNFLNKIGCQVHMLLAPSSFVRHLLGLFPEIEELHSEVIHAVNEYIGVFQEHPAYLLFAPSTVAISSLLIAFSIFNINSELWLKSRIPEACLPSANNPLAANGMLDIVKCLSYFEMALPNITSQSKRKHQDSPTSDTLATKACNAPSVEVSKDLIGDLEDGQESEQVQQNSSNSSRRLVGGQEDEVTVDTTKKHSKKRTAVIDVAAIETDAEETLGSTQ